MKIVIFGGSGFIGSYLVDYLLKLGHEVRIFDRNFEKFRKIKNGVDYYIGDFFDYEKVFLALSGCDYAFHLISTTNPGTSNLDPIGDIQENLVPSIQFLKICVKTKIKKVIFLSSGGAVYGTPDSTPINEDHPLNPESSYGIQKVAIEKYLYFFYKNYGLEYTIVRPSNPYGPRQNPYTVQGLISVALHKLRNEETLSIWGDGTIVRDYIFIDDLIDAIYRVTMSTSSCRIFNIGSGIGYSINEIIRIIEKVVGKKIKVEYMDTRIGDPIITVLDTSRIRKEVGWEVTTDIETGVKHTWEYITKDA